MRRIVFNIILDKYIHELSLARASEKRGEKEKYCDNLDPIRKQA